MTLRKKFIIFSMLWGIVPVFVMASLYIISFRNKSMELVKQNVATYSNDQAVHLEAYFHENISSLNLYSDIPMIRELLFDFNNEVNVDKWQRELKDANQILDNTKKEQSYLVCQLVFNKNGTIIASSNSTYINKKVILSEEEMQKLEDNEVVITDIIENKDFNNGMKSAIIATPIFVNEKYQGSIASVINMSYFQSLVKRVHSFKTGKIAIMDEHGIIAASSDDKESINNINTSNNLYEQWKDVDFDDKPNGIIEYKINGIEKMGYYSRINNTKWAVLSSVELTEFKEPINRSIEDVIIFIFFISLVVVSSYAFIMSHFSKPMYNLLDSMRKIKKGNYKDRFIYNGNNEFGEMAIAFNELIDTVENTKKHVVKKNKQLQSLTSNIPGGVYRSIIINGEHFIDFINSGCLNLLGYKRNEFKKVYGKRRLDIIYEEDRERVECEVKEQIEKYNKFAVEYRIKRNDGSIIWLLDNGRVVKDIDGKVFSYSVTINITDAKLAIEELRLSEERYRIVTSQTDDVIFEWNIAEDTMFCSGNWKNKFEYLPVITNLTRRIYSTDQIYKEDMKAFGEMLNDIINGETYREAEIRMKIKTGEYIWCKIRITAIFDSNGNISKAIGVISDIDKEKKEAEELLFKASRDSLTSLYNKGTTESMIEEYIKNENTEVNGALFLIDLDNFKAINDNLGHLAGDFVLTNISSMLLEVFNEDSIIGRIGGDEFIVFLKNIHSEEFLCKKAEELVNAFTRTNVTSEFSDYKVSGSIGIAKYPEHGTSFEELYINADKATYLAKHKGKNNYCTFEEREDNNI